MVGQTIFGWLTKHTVVNIIEFVILQVLLSVPNAHARKKSLVFLINYIDTIYLAVPINLFDYSKSRVLVST